MASATGKIGPEINQDQQFACAFLMPLENLIKMQCLSPFKHLQLKSGPQVFTHPGNTGSCAPAGHEFLISHNFAHNPHEKEPSQGTRAQFNLYLHSIPGLSAEL